jgi:RimJ/RimL family protein N-acetyltransferase
VVTFDPKPVLLEGRHVRLEPLEHRHLPALAAAARDPEVFQFFLTPPLGTVAEMGKWLEERLSGQATGAEVAWATVRMTDNRLVGATTFLDIRRANRGLEIGNTWLAKEAQRTPVNTEAKLLQLTHAFEKLGAWRVQLKTDERNARSRAAILRLGCTFEGVLRKYQARYDGYVRNTALYSLIAEDWPAVKARLSAKLECQAGRGAALNRD